MYEIDSSKIRNKKFHKRQLDQKIIFEILTLHESGMKPSEIFMELNKTIPKYTINNILYREDYYAQEKELFYERYDK